MSLGSVADMAILVEKDDPDSVYETLDEIGQGSFGSVFKGRHRQTGGIVAIKKMAHTGQRGEEWQEIMKEIKFMSLSDHENCVGYFGSYLKGNVFWVVMEFCVGSAADIIEVFKKPFMENEISSIVHQVLNGLKYIHGTGRLHRDIKAGNILLTSRGKVKIGDFGACSLSSPANTFVGTPCWMAPEVILAMESGLYGPEADIWSLGITCIELAQKKPPLFEINTMSALYHIPQNDPPRLAEPSSWSDDFNDFIHCCLQKDPSQRKLTDALLKHPFVNIPDQETILVDLIRRSQKAAQEQDEEYAQRLDQLKDQLESKSNPVTPVATNAKEPQSVHRQVSLPSPPKSPPKRIFGSSRNKEQHLRRSVIESNAYKAPNKFEVSFDEGTVKRTKDDPEKLKERQSEGVIMKKQVREFRRLQQKQQAALDKVEQHGKEMMDTLLNNQKREMDQLTKTVTSELDKLVSKLKQQMSDHSKQQESEWKKFSKELTSRQKSDYTEFKKNLKKELSDEEKAKTEEEIKAHPKHSNGTLTRGDKKNLKQMVLKDIEKTKEERDESFQRNQWTEKQEADLKLRKKQQEEHHVLQQKSFEEEYVKRMSNRDVIAELRKKHFSDERQLIIQNLRSSHELIEQQQLRTQEFEMEQLRKSLNDEEVALRKEIKDEQRNAPKELGKIKHKMQKDFSDTIRLQKERRRGSINTKDLSKEEKKKFIEEVKSQEEEEVQKFKLTVEEAESQYTQELDESQKRRTDELQQRHAKNLEDMSKYQKSRRSTLLQNHAQQMDKLLTKTAEEKKTLDFELDQESKELAEKRESDLEELTARQQEEVKALLNSPPSERPRSSSTTPLSPSPPSPTPTPPIEKLSLAAASS